MHLPLNLWHPEPPFVDDYADRVAEGRSLLSRSRVALVGLARNCVAALAGTLSLAVDLGQLAASWCLHIETNDNTDGTDQLLLDFCRQYPQATFTSQRLGRAHYGAEFAGRRTIALAEYRAACQQWVRDNAADAQFVIAVDWDAWGGWNTDGVLNGIGWLIELPGAYGMASVSLSQARSLTVDESQQPRVVPAWIHYDAWALRLNSTYDDYRNGCGGWKHQWLPPVGSPPVPVVSAFGGLTIYRTDEYLKGSYDGTSDCEHVPYHDSITRATTRRLFLNPSQRCVMSWMEPTDGQHGND